MTTRTVNNLSIFSATAQKISDYKLLVKFRLNLTVVFSAVMAYLIALPGAINWLAVLVFATGGFLVTGAANALNQVLERDFDRVMNRTADRPLPSGRMSVSEAVMAAGMMSMVGIILLSLFNPLTSLLGMISLISYAFVYTPMKRISSLAVIVGAVPGALPMMIGVVAAQGEITWLAIVLFGIQFLWQFPHFWAIAWLAFEDYAKAGFHLLPSKRGVKDSNTGKQSLIYALWLIPMGLLPFFLGITGWASALTVLLLGLGYSFCAWKFYRDSTRETALRLMFSAFFYLPLTLIVLFIDKI